MASIIVSMGVAVPPSVVTNGDLAVRLDVSDEWIRARTGVRERHIAAPGCATVDLATEAGRDALERAGIAAVDAVVVATTTPDRTIPATAPEVAARLDSSGALAFDLNAGCAGFVYALAVAGGLLDTLLADRVLVVGADTLSRVVDPTDRGTAALFGDGAGAVLLRRGDVTEPGAVGPYDLGSDGDGADLLAVPAGGSKRPASAATIARREHFLRMEGRAVYRHAVARMVASSNAVLARAALGVGDVDYLVGHQANARILQAVAEGLGVPDDRCLVTVDRYGNTSAASIPLALDAVPIEAGALVLLTAFGAGLTWASALLRWPGSTRRYA